MIEDKIYVIKANLFFGFLIYSILWFVLKLILKNPNWLINIDNRLTRTTAFYGVVFIFLTGLVILLGLDDDSQHYLNRVNGNKFLDFSVMSLINLLTLTLLIGNIRRSILFRIILGAISIFTFEQYVILTTSLHRSRAPYSWQQINVLEIILFSFMAFVFYLAITLLIRYVFGLLRRKEEE